MSNYLVTDTELIATADAIRAKIGSSENLVWGESTGFSSDIENIPSSSPHADAVTFYDYDGAIIASYSASDFADLSAMPDNPIHDGLTSQGWNWSLSDAKAYVSKYGKLNIGQMYITSDGKTRIYIELREGRLAPYLGIAVDGICDVDWGDGSNHSTLTGNSLSENVYVQHTYADEGQYVITINVTEGNFSFLGNASGSKLLSLSGGLSNNGDGAYRPTILFIEIGQSIASIGNYAFSSCLALKSITIPDSITSISNYAFNGCYGLISVNIPNGVTAINDNLFLNCNILASVTIPKSIISINTSAFNGCHVLTSITIPDSVTIIANNAFSNCYALKLIIIPDSVTTMASNAFSNCYILTSVNIPDSITSISNYAFNGCYGLISVNIPDSITSIGGNAFNSCFALISVNIPNGIKTISDSAFYNCYALISVIIPNSVTTISKKAFANCYGLGYIKFASSTPPSVLLSDAFGNIPTDCIIYVPAGSLSAYTSATNYPNPSKYTYVEYSANADT